MVPNNKLLLSLTFLCTMTDRSYPLLPITDEIRPLFKELQSVKRNLSKYDVYTPEEITTLRDRKTELETLLTDYSPVGTGTSVRINFIRNNFPLGRYDTNKVLLVGSWYSGKTTFVDLCKEKLVSISRDTVRVPLNSDGISHLFARGNTFLDLTEVLNTDTYDYKGCTRAIIMVDIHSESSVLSAVEFYENIRRECDDILITIVGNVRISGNEAKVDTSKLTDLRSAKCIYTELDITTEYNKVMEMAKML
jgi:hypothetical protein